MNDLNFISSHLPGIGGIFKANPACFKVIELPLYDPCGEGEHIYLSLTRSGMQTSDIVKSISKILKIKERDIGTAGLKDKNAIATQMFSLYMPTKVDALEISKIVCSGLQIKCNLAKRHKNKLKTGHLKGNRFEIRIQETKKDALHLAHQKWMYLHEYGLPNYYGEQRFGREQDNAIKGKEILLGQKKADHRLKKFLVSAFQSELFNKCLNHRVQNNNFTKLIVGDIAIKNQSGGMFVVEDLKKEMVRFLNKEISFTGPMFGKKMKLPNYAVLQLENNILEMEGLKISDFTGSNTNGTRRNARIFLENFSVLEDNLDLLFRFDLPPGSYASIVMKEFMSQG